MFGTNKIEGVSFFKDAPKDSLYVTSIFFTLQGEGPFAGMPALFIRLTKCNLNCGFCDTFFDDGEWMTFAELEKKMGDTIINYFKGKTKYTVIGKTISDSLLPEWVYSNNSDLTKNFPNIVLVITGGEPLLQSNLNRFLQRQVPNFKAVQIESNGIVDANIPNGVTLVCSPKCHEKYGVAVRYLSPSKLILERADCLKFVMSADVASPYNEVPEWAHKWKRDNPEKDIYCSPMNIYNDFPQKIKLLRAEKGSITMAERSTVDEIIDFWEPGLLNLKENEANHKYTAQYCMDHGFKLNLQMHLYAGLA